MKDFKSFIAESTESDYLYHATYQHHEPSIDKHGLKASSRHKNWSDSKKDSLYLAKSHHVALSYAESSDEAPEKHYDSGIVIYKVNKKHLDKSKIHNDENVLDSNDTVEYHKDIPREHLQIHSRHDT